MFINCLLSVVMNGKFSQNAKFGQKCKFSQNAKFGQNGNKLAHSCVSVTRGGFCDSQVRNHVIVHLGL